MNKTRIIPVSIEDVKTLQDVSIETYTDTFAPFNPADVMQAYLDDAYEISKLEKEIQNSNSYFFFLKNGEEVAGYLKLNEKDAQTEVVGTNSLEVERIYVRTKFLRHGYGSKLMQIAEEIARDNGNDAIWLGVWEHNEAALKFYSKMGFKHEGQHSFWMGDDEQVDYIYIKYL